MPPAVRLRTAWDSSSPTVQPSDVGQPHELLMMSGARSGSGLFPARSVCAIIHCMHSMYVAGVPLPAFMLRQPIHLAPGATPIWLLPPSPPAKVPAVWVPWPLSSQGAGEFAAHKLFATWMASCQL